MTKYDLLNRFFQAQTADELPVSFKEVEDIVGSPLPSSAYRYPAWWANDSSSHVQAQAWLDAGYETQNVDMAGKKLVFKRTSRYRAPHAGMGEPQHAFKHGADPMATSHPMIGALKGLLVIEPGYDLTQPAMPEWAELAERKYGGEKPS
jgi:hypothetical protein